MKQLLGLSFALFAGAMLIFAFGPAAGGLKVGDKAPEFTLKNVDGKMYALKDIKASDGKPAKGYIITFTCNTCPFAKMYEDRLVSLHNAMAPKGYPVVAIQPNDPEIMPGDSFAAMQKRAKEKGFPFVYLLDEEQKVYPQYGAERTPHIFLLDSNMKVRYIGAIDDNPQDVASVKHKYVEEAVAAVEAGKSPEITFTKAVGCSIKAK